MPPLSELEAKAYETDMATRTVMLRLLEHKKEIQAELKDATISPLQEETLKSLLGEIDSQINQYRFQSLCVRVRGCDVSSGEVSG